MSWSGFAKFLIGFFLAIAFVIAGSAAAAYYFFAKLTEAPPKPIFDNDSAELKAKAGLVSSPKPAAKPGAAKPVAAKPATSPSPESSPSPSPDLPEGAYRAKVTWKDGLSLRESAGPEANRIGGLVYNQQIIVLKESPDGKWQYVRLAEGSQEGWIKAGNIEKVTEEDQAEASQAEETQATSSSPEPFTR